MRTYVLAIALIAATASMAGLGTGQAAQVNSDITIAAIATGRLYVVGTTERPHTSVSLDGRFTTVSDDVGKFQYELVYHPARCIVAAEIDGKTYEAVVSNCGQQGPVGPPGITASAPVASPTQTGTLPGPTTASSKSRGRQATPPAALHANQTPNRMHAPANREPIRPARFERRKAIVKPKVEQQEPYEEEAPPED